MVRDPWTSFVAQVEQMRHAAEQAAGVTAEAPFETPDPRFGDLAFPCFAHAKAARRPPNVIASDLAARLQPADLVAAITATGPYVNFTADARVLAAVVLGSWRELGPAYGSGEPDDTAILVEHTSVNPTGPVHVGRARNPIFGDSLARLLRLAGHAVTTEYFVNDIGRQMVTLYWGITNLPPPESASPKEDHRLVECYRAASKRQEEDPAVAEAIAAMIFAFENGDAALTKEIRHVAERVLSGIAQTLRDIGVTLDRYFWESDLILSGRHKDVIDRLRPLCQEEDGALFLDMAPYGIQGRETRVFFTRKDGTSLYPTRDLAYHLDKFARCDVAINVLGEDHKLEFEQLRVSLRLMGEEESPEALFYAFVGLPEGRMSTRKGVVVNMDDLVEEAEERALAEVQKRRPELPMERQSAIAKIVSVGALRYGIVKVQPEKNITFSWKEALSFEGDAAPFLQYAHARCQGILAKAGPFTAGEVPATLEAPERALVLALARFPGTVAAAAAARRPHRLATYVYDLATLFHSFYQACPVLEAAEPVRTFRLSLVSLTKHTLARCLDVLGVPAPDEM